MTRMYCIECYLKEGKGVEDAQWILNGKSLCNIHFWDEAKADSNQPVRQKRGYRLPVGWLPSDESINRIIEEFPGVTQEHMVREHRKFCDYWYGVGGQRGVKLDWQATWRNWIRKAAEQGSIGGGTRVSMVDGRVDEALERGLRLAALAREEEDAHQAQ